MSSDLNIDEIKRNMLEKSTKELMDILGYAQDDYNPVVIPIIRDILRERGTEAKEIEDAEVNYQKIVLENKHKEAFKKKAGFWDNKWKVLLYCLGAMILGRYAVTCEYNHNQTKEAEKPWSQAYEQNVYHELYRVADTIFEDSISKKQFVECGIQRLKKDLPNGLESISRDSLRKLNYKIGRECAPEITKPTFRSWTPEYEKYIKRSLMRMPELSKYNEELKFNFCDCYVDKLKAVYPSGITGEVPAEVQMKLAKECLNKLHKVQ